MIKKLQDFLGHDRLHTNRCYRDLKHGECVCGLSECRRIVAKLRARMEELEQRHASDCPNNEGEQ